MITMLITNCDCNKLCNHYDYRQYFSKTIISSITWEFYADYRFTLDTAGRTLLTRLYKILKEVTPVGFSTLEIFPA